MPTKAISLAKSCAWSCLLKLKQCLNDQNAQIPGSKFHLESLHGSFKAGFEGQVRDGLLINLLSSFLYLLFPFMVWGEDLLLCYVSDTHSLLEREREREAKMATI